MNGIALLVDGEGLDLGDAKVRLRIQSPLFQPEFIRHSYSYPFTMPWTPKNARLLRHAERLANVENIIELDADIYLGGLFYKRGVLKYRRYRKGFDCDLLIPPDTVITALGDTMLQDLDLGTFHMNTGFGDPLSDLDDLYSDRLGTVVDTPFVFAPVKNAKPLGEKHNFGNPTNDPGFPDPVPGGYVNHYDVGATYKWWAHLSTLSGIDVVFHVMSPYPYLQEVLRAVFASVKRGISGEMLNEDEFKRMVVVGNMLQVVGITVTTGVLDSVMDIYEDIGLAKALPDMTCIEFLVAMQKRFNGRFVFNALGDARFVTMVDVLDAVEVYDLTELAAPDPDVENNEATGYTLSEQEDELDALGTDRDDALLITPDFEVDAPAGLGGLSPTEGQTALVLSAATLYKYQSASGAGWVYLMPYLPSVVTDSGDTKQDVGVAMTRMYSGADAVLGTRSWLTAEVEMPMSDHDIDIHAVGRNDTKVLRLLFYRGMQVDSLGDEYPLLTNGTLDYNGDAIAGAEWCERIEGDGGIHDRCYRRPMDVLGNAKSVQRYVHLPLANVVAFDFTRKLRLDSINFLAEAIDVEFTVTSMGVPRLDLVKV